MEACRYDFCVHFLGLIAFLMVVFWVTHGKTFKRRLFSRLIRLFCLQTEYPRDVVSVAGDVLPSGRICFSMPGAAVFVGVFRAPGIHRQAEWLCFPVVAASRDF